MIAISVAPIRNDYRLLIVHVYIVQSGWPCWLININNCKYEWYHYNIYEGT